MVSSTAHGMASVVTTSARSGRRDVLASKPLAANEDVTIERHAAAAAGFQSVVARFYSCAAAEARIQGKKALWIHCSKRTLPTPKSEATTTTARSLLVRKEFPNVINMYPRPVRLTSI